MTWNEPQIAQYRKRHALGTTARLALELMLNIAARRHDAHLIGRQHLRDGKLTWRPNKTRRTTGKVLTIRVLPELQAALDAMPQGDALPFLTTDYGRPLAAAFGNKFADWCRAAGLKPVMMAASEVIARTGYARPLASRWRTRDAQDPEIMAVSGHATLTQVQVYIEEVGHRKTMAASAMDKRSAVETKAATGSD